MCKDLAMHRVVVLALDGVYPFELGIPARIFGTADDPDGARCTRCVTCSARRAAGADDADFAIAVEHGASALDDRRHAS